MDNDHVPLPQPEPTESLLTDPGVADLSWKDYGAVLRRAVKEALDDNITLIAGALAYSAFLAIPSVLLVVVGLFSLVAEPETIASTVDRLGDVAPQQTVELLSGSLQRLNDNPATGVAVTVIGFGLALWSSIGAMNAFMTGANIAYDRKDSRSFVRKRVVGLKMLACMTVALSLVFGLLILGPALSDWVGQSVGLETATTWIWWVAQWPFLLLGLLLTFAGLLYLAPDIEQPGWRFVTAGSLVAVAAWLIVSSGFALYTSYFGSYNKTWGTLSAVIVMLVWLWLTSLALLFGSELNAELERSRELREGQPAERALQAPSEQC
jgi:membrane protein